MKQNQQQHHLSDWIKARAGSIVSQFFMTVFLVYVFAISTISFYDLIQSINIYFLPRTPSFVVMLPFLLICIWSAYNGLKSIVYVSAILLPFVSLLGIFVATFTLPVKDYSYLFPILADGYQPVLKGAMIILGGSADLLVLLLLQHHVKKSFSIPNLFFLITFLTVLILGPTMDSLASVGHSIGSEIRSPALERWRLVELGSGVSPVDLLAVFPLLGGELMRVSLRVYLLRDMVEGHLLPGKKKRIFTVAS